MQILKLPDDARAMAVAVSGGADSMALLHILSNLHANVHAITVDHALRDDSAAEAAKVGQWVSSWPNVTHTILRWEGVKPNTGRMELARVARYELMANYCAENDIKYLAVAHHADDQVETFFMRLARGSGLDGLASMREKQIYSDVLTIWRPLLGCASHEDLTAYCRDNDVPWIEDPTNVNMHYTRSRLRAALKNEGLSEKRLTVTMRRLERASDALRILSARLLERARTSQKDDNWTLDLKILQDEPFELSVRVIRAAIEALGNGADYGPRFDRLEDIAHACLESAGPYAATLGGCVLRVHPRRQTLVIASESVEKSAKSLPLTANGL